jgi:hypothetical protein
LGNPRFPIGFELLQGEAYRRVFGLVFIFVLKWASTQRVARFVPQTSEPSTRHRRIPGFKQAHHRLRVDEWIRLVSKS